MFSKRVFLAVDLGASSGRVVAGEFDGHRLELLEHHRFPNGPVSVNGRLHWDILYLFSQIKDGIRKAVNHHRARELSVGIDSWGVDYGLLDREGHLLVNPFHYRDLRVEGCDRRARRLVPPRELYQVTGIQFLPFNTLYQVLADLESPYSAAADRLLFVPDLINYWLTGQKVNEYTIASTSQLLDAAERHWASRMIERLGLPGGWFREIVAPGTLLGKSRPDVTEDVGASFEVIAPACHDTASAVAAVPAQEDSYAFLSSGTWSLMGLVSKDPIINPKSFDAGFSNEGGVGGTIRFLRNISGLWLLQECRRTWLETDKASSYEELTAAAARARPFRALIDPDAALFQTPGDMPSRILRYCVKTGQEQPRDEGELVRTILEGLALKYRYTMERVEQVTGSGLARLHIVGGGTQNDLLNQFASDALNKPVVAGPVEATATGNILLQMLAKKAIGSLSQGRELVRSSFPTRTYDPVDPEGWSQAYDRFLELIGAEAGN